MSGTALRAGDCRQLRRQLRVSTESFALLLASTDALTPLLQADAVNGPTRDKGELPPFQWDDGGDPNEPLLHAGQPLRFDFRFERMAPDPRAAAAAAGCGGGAALHVQQ